MEKSKPSPSECDMDLVKLRQTQRQPHLLQSSCIHSENNRVGFLSEGVKEGNNGEVFYNDVSQSVKATPRLPSDQSFFKRVEAEQQKSYFMIFANLNSMVVQV